MHKSRERLRPVRRRRLAERRRSDEEAGARPERARRVAEADHRSEHLVVHRKRCFRRDRRGEQKRAQQCEGHEKAEEELLGGGAGHCAGDRRGLRSGWGFSFGFGWRREAAFGRWPKAAERVRVA